MPGCYRHLVGMPSNLVVERTGKRVFEQHGVVNRITIMSTTPSLTKGLSGIYNDDYCATSDEMEV